MKIRMLHSIAVWFSIAGLLVLFWVYNTHNPLIDASSHQDYKLVLNELKTVKASFNQGVLESRYRVIIFRDSLDSYLNAMQDLHQQLQNFPPFVATTYQQQLQEMLVTQASLLERQNQLVTDFRQHNFHLKAALNGIEVANAEMAMLFFKQTEWLLKNHLDELLSKIALFNISSDNEVLHNIQATVQKIQELDIANLSEEKIDLATQISADVVTILENKPLADSLTQQLVDLPILDNLLDFQKIYEESYQAAILNQEQQLFYLYIWVIISIIIIFSGLVSYLYRSKIALKRANSKIQTLNCQLHSENRRLNHELDVAKRLQQMILPKESELTEIKELDIAGFMEPADEVGGDYYDVISHRGCVKIGIGDVTGHGLESGVIMLMVQTAVRTLISHNENNAVNFMNTINKAIYSNLQRMNCDRNLSFAFIDYQAGELRITGQHEELIVVNREGQLQRIDTQDLGFPIGLEADITDFVGQVKLNIAVGDIVILYTDGVTEATDQHDQLYGVEQVCKLAVRYRHRSAREIRHLIVEDLKRHIATSKVYDDITLLVIKRVADYHLGAAENDDHALQACA